MLNDCSALILAGGRSERMGCAKTELTLASQTLLQRAVDTVQAIFPQFFISVRKTQPAYPWPQIPDLIPDAGPLSGLCAGLQQCNTPWLFVLAADMPFVTPTVIYALAALRHADSDVLLPEDAGHPQFLCSFYARHCLPTLLAALNSGERRVHASLAPLRISRVKTEALPIATPLPSFFDLDTPADFHAAQKLVQFI